MSLGTQTQGDIRALVIGVAGGAASDMGGGSVGSALISSMLGMLWPGQEQSVWDSIRDDVQNLINQSLNADDVASINAALLGLRNDLRNYSRAITTTPPDGERIRTYYRSTRDNFDSNSPQFQKAGCEILFLPQYAQMINLYLSLLRDAVLYGASWGLQAGEISDTQSDLTNAIRAANAYVDHWFPLGISEPVVDDNNSQISSHATATNYIAHMTVAVLDHQANWPYLDPTQHAPGTPVPRQTREVFSASFWKIPPHAPNYGDNADSIPNWGQAEGLLTEVTGWGGTRPTGVQCGYADGAKPMEGHDNGAPQTAHMLITNHDPIVKATLSTVTPTDFYYIPTFDKQARLYTRSGQEVWLPPSNDPAIINIMGGHEVRIANTDPHTVFFDDHVVSSIHLNYWAGRPFGSIQGIIPDNFAVGNVVVGFRRWDSYADQQQNWRRCHKCQGLFYSQPNYVSVCPSGGAHDASGSVQYVAFCYGVPPESEPGWSWCNKCGAMFTPWTGGQLCAAGGNHNGSDSRDYPMLRRVTDAPGGPVSRTGYLDGSWKPCAKCSVLYRSQNESNSRCPADGGQHNAGDFDRDYLIKHVNPIS